MGLTRPRAHQLQDIDYKQTSRAITTTNITLSGGAPATVDGVSLALNDRVLVTGQSTGSENGIYSVTTVGAGSNGTWARSSDADGAGELNAGSITMVTEGTTYADTQWKLTTDDPITIGSTALTFARNGNAAFGVVAVSGQSDLVSDQIGDTLTLVAGSNVTLTTNAGTDALTIAAGGTPGGSDTQVQFNDSGSFGGDSGLVYNKTTDLLTGVKVALTNTSTDDTLLLTTTEDSSTAGPVITLKRNSASPADADYMGQLKFQGENDADQEVVYAKITAKIQDVSDGTEDGLLEFSNMKAGSNNITARLRSDSLQLLNGTSLTVAGTATVTGDVEIQARSELKLFDSDSSHYVSLLAPATVASSVTLTLPGDDGSSDQVLSTNGSGTLSWVDQSGGGGSGASSYPNSTVTPVPSSEGNFDLSYNYAQTTQETPFESGGTDAFGVSLGEVYSMMDPAGDIPTATDLGVLT